MQDDFNSAATAPDQPCPGAPGQPRPAGQPLGVIQPKASPGQAGGWAGPTASYHGSQLTGPQTVADPQPPPPWPGAPTGPPPPSRRSMLPGARTSRPTSRPASLATRLAACRAASHACGAVRWANRSRRPRVPARISRPPTPPSRPVGPPPGPPRGAARASEALGGMGSAATYAAAGRGGAALHCDAAALGSRFIWLADHAANGERSGAQYREWRWTALQIAYDLIGAVGVLSLALLLSNVFLSGLNRLLGRGCVAGCALVPLYPILLALILALVGTQVLAAGFGGLGALAQAPGAQSYGVAGLGVAHYELGYFFWYTGIIVNVLGMLGELVVWRR